MALGLEVASRLKARLADLDVADTLSAIAVGRPRPAASVDGPCIVLDLTSEMRLVLRVNHQKVPRRQDRTVDWSSVSRVKIMRIDESE